MLYERTVVYVPGCDEMIYPLSIFLMATGRLSLTPFSSLPLYFSLSLPLSTYPFVPISLPSPFAC